MSEVVYALGRIAVPVVFIVFGYLQVTNIGSYITNPAVVKFIADTGNVLSPAVVAWTVAAVDLIGGILVLIGFKARWAAIGLIVFVLLTIWFAHPYWTMEGAAYAGNRVQALKNLAIIGALLMIAAHGSGRYSVDGMRAAA